MDEEPVFNANAACDEVREMWLGIAKHCKAMLIEADWIDSAKEAVEAIRLAQLAEACFWQATGESPTFSIGALIPPLAVRENTDG